VSLTEYGTIITNKVMARLSEEDEAALRERFTLLDNNGDGYISKSELCNAAKAMPLSSKRLLSVFDDDDHDGDGTISFEEFVEEMKPLSGIRRVHTWGHRDRTTTQ
jgi:Ca2+-binding EF-hand superfamily protein